MSDERRGTPSPECGERDVESDLSPPLPVLPVLANHIDAKEKSLGDTSAPSLEILKCGVQALSPLLDPMFVVCGGGWGIN